MNNDYHKTQFKTEKIKQSVFKSLITHINGFIAKI